MSYQLQTPEEEVKEYSSSYTLLYASVVLTFAILGVRLWYLQIYEGNEHRYISERNLVKKSTIYAPRGRILDREGRILVDNQAGFEAIITPQYAAKLEDTAKAIAPILNLQAARIVKKVKKEARQNGKYRPVRIKENLSRDEVTRLSRLQLDHPGLDINMFIKRTYPFHENGAQFLGYVGEISERELPVLNKERSRSDKFHQGDIIGKTGLELNFDDKLRGEDGLKFIQVDAFGRETRLNTSGLFSAFKEKIEAKAGKHLGLTIDADIQEAAYQAFNLNDKIGAAVALDPNNGEVLAWVNAPSFDPNNFTTGISSKLWKSLMNDPFKPLRNKVIQDHNPPGSTFKAVVALAALNEGVITDKTTHNCNGKFRLGRKTYHCHLRYGHGKVDIYTALERSCNVFFYKIANQLGMDKIAKYARALGAGSKTGIDLSREIPGLIPDTDWKQKQFREAWQPGETLSNAIGQGYVLFTPLQLATVFSSIAKNGKVFRPHLVKKVLNSKDEIIQEMEPEVLKDHSPKTGGDFKISKKAFSIVQKGLFLVNNGERGTAKWWKIPGVEIAGKTGTAQLFNLSSDQVFAKCEERPIKMRHHGWYVGFAPAEDPKIVVAVLAEHACHGSTGGAPVARDIIRAYMKKYYPEKLKSKKYRQALLIKAEE
ncbi:MAG: penicillin-binding protein 2 [Bdellovibrionaceae bacterium]|nr:penicillin-binding protein 2 [Pseudobdellovibrionaceae bacterium]